MDIDGMHDAYQRALWDVEHGTHSGYCVGCRCTDCRRANTNYQRAYMLRRRQNFGAPLRTVPTTRCEPNKLPIEPLLRLFEHLELSDEQLAVQLGTTRNAIKGWRRRGLSLRTGDRVACRLGHHPFVLWGAAYWSAR